MMKKSIKTYARSLCMIIGCALILGAAALLIYTQVSRRIYDDACDTYVQRIQDAIPPVYSAYPEPRRDNTMPCFASDSVDFVALLEFPAYASTLPVRNTWHNPEQCPNRFSGSVYNNTMIIGATDRDGQLDFVKVLQTGDLIYLTDMTGGQYRYEITDIQVSKRADAQTLSDGESDLTVFVKISTSFDYYLLRCDIQQ